MCVIKNKLLLLQFVRYATWGSPLPHDKDNKAKLKQQKYENC